MPTLNELIAVARGRCLARMDADDVCRPRRFEMQIAYLNSHPECVAVGSRVLFIDPEGMPIFVPPNELTHEEINTGHMSGVLAMRICHPSVMMRKEAVLQVGKYREKYNYIGEDLDLFLRLAEIRKLANLAEVLFEYRQLVGGYSHTRRNVSLKFARQVAEEAAKRRGVPINPKIFKSQFRPETLAETHRKWAWWALSAGNQQPQESMR